MADVRDWSGLYLPTPGFPAPIPFRRCELRLDVDGPLPNYVLSGFGVVESGKSTDFFASIRPENPNSDQGDWTGTLRFAPRTSRTIVELFQNEYDRVRLQFHPSSELLVYFRHFRTFTEEGHFRFARVSPFFRQILVDIDFEQGINQDLGYIPRDLFDHEHVVSASQHLPNKKITLKSVMDHVGFEVTLARNTNNPGPNPLVLPQAPGGSWSNAELIGRMEESNFFKPELGTNQRQLPFWAFIGSRHEEGDGLAGIMFDSAKRQGAAVFTDSILIRPLDTNQSAILQKAWSDRMTLWTLVHELGHAMNLSHCWSRPMSIPWPWQGGSARDASFMNYPHHYDDGHVDLKKIQKFFQNFEFTFDKHELLFLRHAPEVDVRVGSPFQGGSDARMFEIEDRQFENSDLRIKLSSNRPEVRGYYVFDFLEPINLDYRLTNESDQPVLIDKSAFRKGGGVQVIVRPRNKPERYLAPFLHECRLEELDVLRPRTLDLEEGKLYGNVQISVGKYGWLIDDPGIYDVYLSMRFNGSEVVSNRLPLRIEPPVDHAQACLAQEFYTGEMGEQIAVGGIIGKRADNCISVLREISDRYKTTRAGVRAAATYLLPRLKSRFESGSADNLETAVVAPCQEAIEYFRKLHSRSKKSQQALVQSFGNIGFDETILRAARRVATTEHQDVADRILQRGARVAEHVLKECLKKDKSPVVTSVLKRFRDAILSEENLP